MDTIMKNVMIPHCGRLHIELELPAGFPAGEAVVTLEPKNRRDGYVNGAAAMCGKGRGKVWMADDFDAPLDDFAEYM